MLPKTLSASSLLVFEGCEARFLAENIERAPTRDNVAALKGTLCHEVLELWVKQGLHVKDWPNIQEREKAMNTLFRMIYPTYFPEETHFAECWSMVNRWLQRTDFTYGRKVLSTEQKETFPLPTSVGDIPVTYIWDRCDELADGAIEVVDYKTIARPVQPDDLKHKIQPRIYGLAANIKYPEAHEIWVTFDLLRYNAVSTVFTREDNKQTWKWLKSRAEAIIASDGTKETLNPECRYCIRKHECETLKRHTDGGGILGITSLFEAIDRRAKVKYAIDGMMAALNELDEAILDMAENEDLIEADTESTKFKIKASKRRTIDSKMASRVIGPELMAEYGKVGVTDIDNLMKDNRLTDSQKSQLKQLVKAQFGNPSVFTEPKMTFTEDD